MDLAGNPRLKPGVRYKAVLEGTATDATGRTYHVVPGAALTFTY